MDADGAQLVACVVPHGLVLAVEDVSRAETGLQGVKGGGDDGLDAPAYEAGCEGHRGGWWWVDALGLVGRGFVKCGETMEVCCI